MDGVVLLLGLLLAIRSAIVGYPRGAAKAPVWNHLMSSLGLYPKFNYCCHHLTMVLGLV